VEIHSKDIAEITTEEDLEAGEYITKYYNNYV
jgi:hypothetical protein